MNPHPVSTTLSAMLVTGSRAIKAKEWTVTSPLRSGIGYDHVNSAKMSIHNIISSRRPPFSINLCPHGSPQHEALSVFDRHIAPSMTTQYSQHLD